MSHQFLASYEIEVGTDAIDKQIDYIIDDLKHLNAGNEVAVYFLLSGELGDGWEVCFLHIYVLKEGFEIVAQWRLPDGKWIYENVCEFVTTEELQDLFGAIADCVRNFWNSLVEETEYDPRVKYKTDDCIVLVNRAPLWSISPYYYIAYWNREGSVSVFWGWGRTVSGCVENAKMMIEEHEVI